MSWNRFIIQHQHHLLGMEKSPSGACLTQTSDDTQVMLWPYGHLNGCNGEDGDCLRRCAWIKFWCRDWTSRPPVALETLSPRPPASLDLSESMELIAFDESRNLMIYEDDGEAVCVHSLETGHPLWRRRQYNNTGQAFKASCDNGIFALAVGTKVEVCELGLQEPEEDHLYRSDFGITQGAVCALRCIGSILFVVTTACQLSVRDWRSPNSQPLSEFHIHSGVRTACDLDVQNELVLLSCLDGFVFADWRSHTRLGVLRPELCEQQLFLSSRTSYSRP